MAATTADPRALLLAVVATMVTAFLHSTPAGAARPSAVPAKNKYVEFVRRSCSSTLYPSLCYASLADYANAVAQDPTRLAVVAANVSLARVRSASSHVTSLRRTAAAARKVDVHTLSALGDCEETLGDAADLTRRAAHELKLLPTAKGTEVARRVNNAQTWMSSALTNEDTCMDGFAEVPSSAVKGNVSRRVRQAGQYTSNALALVNRLARTNR